MSDDFRDLDLRGFDLERLDLDHIELEGDRPSPVWRWLVGLFLLGVTALLIWLPRSNLYGALNAPWVSFTFSLAGIVVGLLSGRFLWTLLSELRPAPELTAAPEPVGPPSAARRFASLLVVLGGTGIILYVTQSGQVGNSGTGWFLVALGAIVVGITFGRWLTMQAQAVDRIEEPAREPVRLPPWFKWVTLAVVVVGGLGVALGPSLFPGNEDLSLALSAGGFAVGIVAAIWLARRFEEEEERLRNQRGG